MAFGYLGEISFQMRPTHLSLMDGQPMVGTVSVGVNNPSKPFPNQVFGGLLRALQRHPKYGHQGGT